MNKMTGEAAELFVRYKLMLWGIPVTNCADSFQFDLIAYPFDRPIRIQVKSTLAPRSEGGRAKRYFFPVNHGIRKTSYPEGSYDILALVALDEEKIIFQAPAKTTKVRLKPELFVSGCSYKTFHEVLNEHFRNN